MILLIIQIENIIKDKMLASKDRKIKEVILQEYKTENKIFRWNM